MELLLERSDRALDLARASPHGPRHPVERAQLVDDRAADTCHSEGLELDLAVRVEPLDRADQAEQPVRDEVLLVDVRGKARADAAGDELHERRVREDEPVAKVLVVRPTVVLPEGLSWIRSSHGKRIRRERAESSGATPTQRPSSEVTDPESEGRRGKRDHPRGAAFERRVDRHERKAERECDEQEAEKAAAAPPER